MEKLFAKSDIEHATYEAGIRTDNRPWRYVELFMKSMPADQSHLVNLPGFSMADVKKLLSWLPNLEL